MAVKIRMKRLGRRHRPFFRINAVDDATPRNGRILEKLGHYDPIEKDKEKQLVLDLDRVKFWIDKGAVPSDTVSEMLEKLGIKTKALEERRARRERAKEIAKKKGKFFTKAQKIAAEKAAEEAKIKAEQEAKAAEEAKKKAEEEAKKKAEEQAAEEAAKQAEAKTEESETPAEEKAEEKKDEASEEKSE